MTRIVKNISVAVATVTATLLLTSCSSTNPTSSDLRLPGKNIAEWVMPLDQYISTNWNLDDYAENLLVQPCMEKAGYSWDVPWRDVTTTTKSDTANAIGRRLFNTTVAAKWGYHDALDTSADAQAWREFVAGDSDISDEEDQILTACVYAARDVLPRLDGQDQMASTYAQAAFEKAKRASAVTQAEDKWAECMAGEGVSDLPRDPHDMPTRSMVRDLGMDSGDSASSEEIRVATKDAQCRDSSGFTEMLYAAEWDGQVALLGQNADTLERIKVRISKYRSAALDVITSHAPHG